jgi:hypothetical protein
MGVSTSRKSGTSLLLGLLAALCCAAAALPARAQATGMDAIADKLAKQLHKKHVKKVAVARLTPKTQGQDYALSIWISDQLAVALAAADKKLQVIPRSKLLEDAQRRHVPAIDMGLVELVGYFALKAGADAIVEGEFDRSGQSVKLNVWAVDLRHARYDGTAEGTVQEMPQVVELKDTPVRDPATGVYMPGVADVSYPECIRCANPTFPKLDCSAHPDFAILIAFTVTSAGKVTDIEVVDGPDISYNKIAIEAVKSWQFHPSRLPDGTPVASRMAGRLACGTPAS